MRVHHRAIGYAASSVHPSQSLCCQLPMSKGKDASRDAASSSRWTAAELRPIQLARRNNEKFITQIALHYLSHFTTPSHPAISTASRPSIDLFPPLRVFISHIETSSSVLSFLPAQQKTTPAENVPHNCSPLGQPRRRRRCPPSRRSLNVHVRRRCSPRCRCPRCRSRSELRPRPHVQRWRWPEEGGG